MHNEVFDDLYSRFLISIPTTTKNCPTRLLFDMELAFWYYDDSSRKANRSLPKLTMVQFVERMIRRHTSLQATFTGTVENEVKSWQKYKRSVPTFGGIMFNKDFTKVLLVKGFHSKKYSFPKGKKNQKELPLDCAIREVKEETGFDITDMVDKHNYSDNVRTEGARCCRLYYVPGVPEDTVFQAACADEIDLYKWMEIKCLDRMLERHYNKYHIIQPHLKDIKAYAAKKLKEAKEGPAAKQTSKSGTYEKQQELFAKLNHNSHTSPKQFNNTSPVSAATSKNKKVRKTPTKTTSSVPSTCSLDYFIPPAWQNFSISIDDFKDDLTL